MREVEPGGDAKSGAAASDGSPSSEPPPSSTRGFIGTNIDAVQAYVPPTTLPEAPEPLVPDTKVALSEGVDPRKLPTMPNLKRAAKSLAAELRGELKAPVEAEIKPEIKPERKRPAPVIEAPPDSQISSIRRGAGYAPSRGHSPSGAPASSARISDPIPRATPAKGIGIKASVRPPPPAEPVETPTQRRAALLFIFLFAALLAVAVYFFLRRAPAPPTDAPAPSSSALAPSATSSPSAPSTSP